MEGTHRAIRQGRVLADEGLYTHANDAWKDALSGAYAAQDFAGMFVLSGNVGEACVRLAAQETEAAGAMKLLQEAAEHLDYALQLVEQCSLREVLGGYRALYRSVRRVEALRRKAAQQLQQLMAGQAKQRVKCATCGVESGEMVLDENDGCEYCRGCYEEYYAAAKAVEDVDEEVAVEDVAEEGAVEDVAEDEVVDDASGFREKECEVQDEAGGAGAGVAAVESDPAAELVEVVPLVDERTEEVDDRCGVTLDRIRYERVELGSLADFLAGNVGVDDSKEECESRQIDISRSGALATVEGTPVDDSQKEKLAEAPVAALVDLQRSAVAAATSDEGAPTTRVAEVPAPNKEEDTAETASAKREYSILQLLELRKHSPTVCPEALLASPVRDDGTASTFAHNKTNSGNGRKKANSSKKTSRSAASHRQNKTDAAGSNNADALENADATSSISPLPTLGMCAALREALQEQQSGSGTSCDSSMATGTLYATAQLSDSPSSLADHVRLRSE